MAKIIINHLGAIKEFEMEIKQFNLMIGEQATGKSTICKAIYFFRSIKNELIEYLYSLAVDGETVNECFPKALNSKCKNIFVELFGYSWNLPDDLNMEYYFSEDIVVKVYLKRREKGKKYISINYSKKLTEELKKLEKKSIDFFNMAQRYDTVSGFASTERLRRHQEIVRDINALFFDDLETYYIPAGRSLLTLMTNQKTKLDYDTIDLVNRKFMQFIENIQPKFSTGISTLHQAFPKEERKFDVTQMSKQIIAGIKGEYVYNQGREYLIVPDNQERVPINFSSSGQQEVLWLLNQLYVLLLREEKAFIIIEEPEAHLYPKLQKEVMEFIAQFVNLTGSTVFVTTHSPYILTCVNALAYAGRLLKNETIKEQVEKITGKNRYLNPQKLNAFKLQNNFKEKYTDVENLLNADTDELSTELIDDVSDTINKTYTRLFYLEEIN